VAKPTKVAKLWSITFLMFIPSVLPKHDHDHEIWEGPLFSGKRSNITFWDHTENRPSVIQSSRCILISWRRSMKPIRPSERSRQQGPDSYFSHNSQIHLWSTRLIGIISSRFGVSARYIVKKLCYSVSPSYWVLPQHCTYLCKHPVRF
jgi:hypothetical protein